MGPFIPPIIADFDELGRPIKRFVTPQEYQAANLPSMPDAPQIPSTVERIPAVAQAVEKPSPVLGTSPNYDSARQRLADIVANVPQRQEPSRGRRILAALAGFGLGAGNTDPRAAKAMMDDMLFGRHDRNMEDYGVKLKAAQVGYGSELDKQKMDFDEQRQSLQSQYNQERIADAAMYHEVQGENQYLRNSAYAGNVSNLQDYREQKLKENESKLEQERKMFEEKTRQFNETLKEKGRHNLATEDIQRNRPVHSATDPGRPLSKDEQDHANAVIGDWKKNHDLEAYNRQTDKTSSRAREYINAELARTGERLPGPTPTQPEITRRGAAKMTVKTINDVRSILRKPNVRSGPIVGRWDRVKSQIGVVNGAQQELITSLNFLLLNEAATFGQGRGAMVGLLNKLAGKSGDVHMNAEELAGALREVERHARNVIGVVNRSDQYGGDEGTSVGGFVFSPVKGDNK